MRPPLLIAASLGVLGAALIGGQRRRRQPDDSRLSALSHALTQVRTPTKIFEVLERNFRRTFAMPLAIVASDAGRICIRFCSTGFSPNSHDLETASLALRSGCRTGWGTPGTPNGLSCFLPLNTAEGIVGAIGFKIRRDGQRISPRTWHLLECFADHAALAMIRVHLRNQADNTAPLREKDKLQKALLDSISHNVRTPLASIIGALSTLQGDGLNEGTRLELIDTARDGAERLNRLLGNLLDMSRLDAGVVGLRRDFCDIQDVIGAALEQLGSIARNRSIDAIIPPDLPFVGMDFVLIVQVLFNLLDNAIKYSLDGTRITVEPRVLKSFVVISVFDEGDGIPEQNLTAVFEKFNCGGRAGETAGIGLGLSICKALVEAHQGEIWAERRPAGGTAVRFTLPLDAASQE